MHLSGVTPTTPLRRGFGPFSDVRRGSGAEPERGREFFLTKDMFYWTSEIAGKVKEILIINPQQCGPEPQIFADGERQGRAGVGKGACFAPGEGERGFWGAPDVFAKGAEPGGGRFGALIGVVSAWTSAGIPGRRAGADAGWNDAGMKGRMLPVPRKARRRNEPGGKAVRECGADSEKPEPRGRSTEEPLREGGEETPRVVRPCAARLDCGLRAFLSGAQPGSAGRTECRIAEARRGGIRLIRNQSHQGCRSAGEGGSVREGPK